MAKRSRRTRRQETQKQPVSDKPTPAVTLAEEAIDTAEEPQETRQTVESSTGTRTIVNFAYEYFYVYHEMRNILITAVLMFLVMMGLSFTI